jgi:VWFA-related protein
VRSLAVLLTFVALGAAQQAPAPQQPPPTFKSGVQLVEVDARVFDKSDRFVPDLTRDDFEVLENGVPQKIDAMYLVGPAQPASTIADPAAVLPDPGRAKVSGPVAPQTWIFFFDLNHLTPGGGFDRARKAVEDFVRDRFREGDVGGVLAGDKMVNNRLTSVRQELLDAVKQVKPRNDTRTRYIELTREWPRLMNEEEALRIARGERQWMQPAIARACAEEPEQCPVADSAVQQKAQRLSGEIQRASMTTLTSLNGLASGLARIPGPKSVVFLSDGFVAQEVETTLRSVVGQTARAGARVYAIDVRGLDRAGQRNLIDQSQVDDPAGAVIRTDSVADGPNSVAVDTGGLMIRNENNIGRALDRIAEDAGRYYVLAYQPSNANFDGKYRPIQVRVKREGLRVRARRGYLALPPSRMLTPQPIKSEPPDPVAAAAAPPPAVTPASEPAPPTSASIEPVSALPSSSRIIDSPGAAPVGGVRLRPDVEGRVKALSERDDNGPRNDLVEQGWEAYQKGDVETAAAVLGRAADAAEAKPWVHYALGMSQAALGRADAAINSWERVRRAVPDFEPVYMDLADTYAAKSDLTAALAIVREAEKRWPNSADVHSAIGVIHVRRGAIDEGIRSLTRVTELTPDDALAFLNLGRAYALRYHRERHYVSSQRTWVAPGADRNKAIEALRQCVKLGGPYASQAAQELSGLEWAK